MCLCVRVCMRACLCKLPSVQCGSVAEHRVMWGELHRGCNDISCSFSCVFSDSLLFTPIPWFVSGDSLPHPFQTEQNRTAPTGRGRSLVCWVMSVFGEDECVGSGGLDESGEGEKRRVWVGGNTRSPTEMLNSITDWKRGKRTLYKDEEKRSTFNLCAI